MTVRSIDIYHVAVPLKKPIRHASLERVDQRQPRRPRHARRRPRRIWRGGPAVVRHRRDDRDGLRQRSRRLDLARAVSVTPARPRRGRPPARRALDCPRPRPTLAGWPATPPVRPGARAARRLRPAVRASRSAQAIRAGRSPRTRTAAATGAAVRYSGAITAETPEASGQSRPGRCGSTGSRRSRSRSASPARTTPRGWRSSAGSSASGWTSGSTPTRRGRRSRSSSGSARSGRSAPRRWSSRCRMREVDALAELRPRLGVPVMLDESLCGYPDAIQAIERRTADLFNVRLSKCGGIIPSLRIIALAHRSGLGRAARLPSRRDRPALGGGPACRQPGPRLPLRRGLV